MSTDAHDSPAIPMEDQLKRAEKRLEDRLKVVKYLREALRRDPGLAEELVATTRGAVAVSDATTQPAGVATPPKTFRGTYYDRIVKCFRAQGNPWLSVTDIREQTDVPRSGVANVLYKSKSADFEKKQHPTHRKMQLWRLRDEVANQDHDQDHHVDGPGAKEGEDHATSEMEGPSRPPSGGPQ